GWEVPMFAARRLGPHAAGVPPAMEKRVRVGRGGGRVRRKLPPQGEPLSIDEAFMDLTGTERLHRMTPAKSLARFATRVEQALAITVSIGLSVNKFLAKIASDLDKPRGFAVLGGAEARAFLAPKPVGFIWGVGKASEKRLKRDGFFTVADLAAAPEGELARRYGVEGLRLARLSRGIDERKVTPEREAKSVSAETTFDGDLSAFQPLERRLWPLAEKVSARLKASGLAGSTVTLKLKSDDFKIRTRARGLGHPTQLAEKIFAAGRELLAHETDGTCFRLIRVGVSEIVEAAQADPRDPLEQAGRRKALAERAVDRVREKFGRAAVIRGLAFEEDG